MSISPLIQDRSSSLNARSLTASTGITSPLECDDAAELTDASTASGHPDKCITVLLVEARTLLRQGINALLASKHDINVIGQAPDCRQALDLAEKLRPDVVIVALGLALRNGLESLRRLLEASCGTRLLVLLPHNDNNVLVEHVAIAGAAGCLTEQAGSRLLAAAVRAVHERNRFFGRTAVALESPPPPSRHRYTGPVRNCTRLTSRELEVLQLIAEGYANKQTASKLGISIKTVEKHRQHMMTKLGIHETATLTRYAVYAGIA